MRALLREKSAGRYLYLSNNNKVVQTGFLSAKCRYWQPCLPRWALGLEAKNSQLCFAEFFCQSVSAEQFSWLSFFSTKSEQVNIEPTVCVRCNLTEKNVLVQSWFYWRLTLFFCELRSRSLKGEIPVLFLGSRTKKKSVVSPGVFKIVENFCIKTTNILEDHKYFEEITIALKRWPSFDLKLLPKFLFKGLWENENFVRKWQLFCEKELVFWENYFFEKIVQVFIEIRMLKSIEKKFCSV